MAVLDTPPEECFDALTRLAANTCETPIALVSLLDGERLWFKSVYGLSATQMNSACSFCSEAANSLRTLEVPDATRDPRFASHCLVTGPLGIRYYAGAPIMYNNVAIGTMCVLDYAPRGLPAKSLRALEDMADIARALLTARMNAFSVFSETRS